MLTGKALQDFDYWFYKTYDHINVSYEYDIDREVTLDDIRHRLPQEFIYFAQIIFLDSAGIYIEFLYDRPTWGFQIFKDNRLPVESIGGYVSRFEAAREGIKKANEIYNKNES